MLHLREIVFCVAWTFRAVSRETPLTLFEFVTTGPLGLILWVGTPVFFAGLAWYAHRLRRELSCLAEMRRQLVD